MTVEVEAASAWPDGVDVVARPVLAGLVAPDGSADTEAAVAARQGFSGAVGETATIARENGSLEVLVGMGQATDLDLETCRLAGAALAGAAAACETVALDVSGIGRGALFTAETAQATAEGVLLASYRFGRLKSDPKSLRLRRVVLVDPDVAAVAAGVDRAIVTAGAVAWARDLVNAPAGELSPARFAEIAAEAGARQGFSVSVWDDREIVAAGLGGLAGVARGSAEPPRLVRAEYAPADPAAPTVALVGKGITFDSGGLSLKTADSMVTMKYDMSGAGAVLAVLGACRSLGVGVRVVGFMPMTENMPGGRAIKPGDVVRIRNGRTIEVLNTDCEGRLVLADALCLAAEESPDAIVDVATLTAAVVVALGRRIAGLMGNDERIVAALEQAAARAGEAVWHLPLPWGYRAAFDSEIADLKNLGTGREAGALVAGLILEGFVGATPWAHLDVCGPAYAEEATGYLRKGGTGFGVRTLLELLCRYQPLGSPAGPGAAGRRVVR
ncbi:MAG TPA: leucyl aminopeptidase [Acidimicrobiales bacterium]|nr:leucyl aminopeptidase [Acidimicrobiales bacterium]